MRLSLEILGRRFALDLTSEREPQTYEPQPQGSACGDLDRANAWDHDTREPIGFTRSKGNQ